jgi:hypothetical protein
MALPEAPETIDAVAYALSLVHEDVRAIRQTVTGHDARFDAIDQSLADPRPTMNKLMQEIARISNRREWLSSFGPLPQVCRINIWSTKS